MGEKTGIQWTNHTFNPWWGCAHVSPGCVHCYAERDAKRYGNAVWGATAPRRFFGNDHWRAPLKWNQEAEREGRRHRVFCASMADVFEPRDDLGSWREKLWMLITETPWLDWQLLTKRPEMVDIMAPWGYGEWPANIWIGTSVENQEWADKRIPILSQIPAAVRFLSCEPLIGPVDLQRWLGVEWAETAGCWGQEMLAAVAGFRPKISWCIIGGESGAGYRPMAFEWADTLVEQCGAARIPVFVKATGNLMAASWGLAWGRYGVLASGTSGARDASVSATIGNFVLALTSARVYDGVTRQSIGGDMADTNTEIAVRDHAPQAYRAMVTVQEIQARADLIDACKAQAMKPGIHYGIIPGTGSKPTLLKPGAEKLDVLFQLRPEFRDAEEREPDGHLTITSYCSLVHIPTGDALVKDASGSCSTHESKYAWRKGERECPECGQPAILKSKHEGEGWFCWNKRGGCGSKFDLFDSRITGQVVGRIPNPDLPDQWNTVRKMAQKRSHIAATLAATAASDVFTQDLDDLVETEAETGNGGTPRTTGKPAAKPSPKAATVVSNDAPFDPNPAQTATTSKPSTAEKPVEGAITPAHIKGLLFTVRKIAELTGDTLTDEAAYAEIGLAGGVEELTSWGLDRWTAAQAEAAGKELNRNLSDLRKAQETEGKP